MYTHTHFRPFHPLSTLLFYSFLRIFSASPPEFREKLSVCAKKRRVGTLQIQSAFLRLSSSPTQFILSNRCVMKKRKRPVSKPACTAQDNFSIANRVVHLCPYTLSILSSRLKVGNRERVLAAIPLLPPPFFLLLEHACVPSLSPSSSLHRLQFSSQ